MGAMPVFPFRAVNAFVLGKQHLLPGTAAEGILQIVRDTAGLHATSGTTPYLSLHARSPGFGREALDELLYERRALAKVRCIRGTIYIQPRDWIVASLAATRRRNLAQTAAYSRRAGISDRRYEALSSQIAALLKRTAMTAVAIRKALDFVGDISAALYRMCDEGLLLRDRPDKGWRDRSVRYCLFREAFPDLDLESIDEAAARRTLVEQYLRCFGPAVGGDIAWWTGFSKAEVREALGALRPRIAQIALEDAHHPALILHEDLEGLAHAGRKADPAVNLLPALDGYLMGYRHRERYLLPKRAEVVFDRSGNVTSTILADGVIVGVWDWEEGAEPLVKVHFLSPVSEGIRNAAIERAIELGGFLFGRDGEVRFCESMGPLSERPAGSVMAPLKGAKVVKRVG